MARLPRLALPGAAHLVILRAADPTGSPVWRDDTDLRDLHTALFDAARAEAVQVHAHALAPEAVHLLATPAEAASLGRWVQALGRRYGAAYNRRHARRGSLWDGRYRAAVLQAGPTRLQALLWVDSLGAALPEAASSRAQHLGARATAPLRDLPEYWGLGNTPFDREARYRELLEAGLAQREAERLLHAALGGWALGDAAFAEQVAEAAGRAASPRPRGRPRRDGS